MNRDTIERIFKNDIDFYTDKNNPQEVFAEFADCNGAPCFVPIRDRQVEAFIVARYCMLEKKAEQPDYGELLNVTENLAIYNRQNPVTVCRRLSGSISKGSIRYALADASATIYEITAGGWKPGTSSSFKFLHRAGDKPQDQPVTGGDVKTLLRPYINLGDRDYTLFLILLIQAFSRDVSHFAVILSSAKGTGKTTLSKLVHELIDPEEVDVAIAPTKEDDLIVSLAASYLAFFDNTAVLTAKTSDLLCAAITGAKERRRKFYTNSETVQLDLHNFVLLNGIEIVPYRSDLAERCLYFSLQKLASKARRTEASFWSDFRRDRPTILGGIFDVLSRAMALLATVKTRDLDRMADAHMEMLAIALALGISEREFDELLAENHERLANAYAENNPFITAVADYVYTRGQIRDQAAVVFERVRSSVNGQAKFFPGSASAFSRRLGEEENALLMAGVKVVRYADPKNENRKIIQLLKVNEDPQKARQGQKRQSSLLNFADDDEEDS